MPRTRKATLITGGRTRRAIVVPSRRMRRTRVPKPIKTYVKKAIARDSENKTKIKNLTGTVSGNADLILTPASSTLPQYFDLSPVVTAGTGYNNRIGNKIRLKSFIVDCQFFLSYAAITATTDCPVNIYYFVLNTRDTPATLSASDLDKLFYNESGTTQYLSGSGFANTQRLNHDFFNIIAHNYPRRPIKLGYSQYSSGGLGSNNDYKESFHLRLNLTKKLNKVIRFDASNTTAVNNNFYLCFYVQKANLDTATTNWDPPQVYPSYKLTFEDM